MNIKNGDMLPDAKVFILDKDPKEVFIKQIIGDEKLFYLGCQVPFTVVLSNCAHLIFLSFFLSMRPHCVVAVSENN